MVSRALAEAGQRSRTESRERERECVCKSVSGDTGRNGDEWDEYILWLLQAQSTLYSRLSSDRPGAARIIECVTDDIGEGR
jgi:hypothetical protein